MKRAWWGLESWLLNQLLKRCPHDGRYVAADILEGALQQRQVQLCKRCGAVRFTFGDVGVELPHYGEWRRPNPIWAEDPL